MKGRITRLLLITAALLSAAMLAPAGAAAQEYENDDLKVTFIEAYDPIWNDAGLLGLERRTVGSSPGRGLCIPGDLPWDRVLQPAP